MREKLQRIRCKKKIETEKQIQRERERMKGLKINVNSELKKAFDYIVSAFEV